MKWAAGCSVDGKIRREKWGPFDAGGVQTAARRRPATMLTREEDVEANALRKRGWSISAIARHLGRDRGTVQRHLNGEHEAGTRRRPDDWFAAFVPYIQARFEDDKHLWTIESLDQVLRLIGGTTRRWAHGSDVGRGSRGH